jgi:hypothetical protein
MNILSVAKAAVELVRSRLWPFLLPLIKDVGTYTLGVLTELAYGFVTEIEKDPEFIGDGDAKRRWVAAQLKKHPFVTSNELAARLINFAIEAAVNRMVAEKSAGAA